MPDDQKTAEGADKTDADKKADAAVAEQKAKATGADQSNGAAVDTGVVKEVPGAEATHPADADPFPKPTRTLVVRGSTTALLNSKGIHENLTTPQGGELAPVWQPPYPPSEARVVRPAASVGTHQQVTAMRGEVTGEISALFNKIRVYFGDVGHEFEDVLDGLFPHVHPDLHGTKPGGAAYVAAANAYGTTAGIRHVGDALAPAAPAAEKQRPEE